MKRILSVFLIFSFLFALSGFSSAPNVSADKNELGSLSGELILPEILADKPVTDHICRNPKSESLNTLAFYNSDNTLSMYVFDTNVKYVDESGEIRDKSTRIIENENGFKNTDNDIHVFFPFDLSDGVNLVYDNSVISLFADTNEKSSQNAKVEVLPDAFGEERERVVYENVFDGADLVYTPTFDGFKEDIVLHEIPETTSFDFFINVGSLSLDENLNISKNGEPFAKISEIVAIDSKSAFSEGAMQIEELDSGFYSVHVTLDEGFLQEADYPVYIDPSINIDTAFISGVKTIQDAPVYSNKSSNYGSSKYNYCGYVSNTYGYSRTLMQFPGMFSDSVFTQLEAAQIVSVTLNLREASGNSGTATINCFTFLDSWNESTVTKNNVNLNNYYNDVDYIVGMSYNTSPKWWTYNITNIVKGWKLGTFSNCGIEFRNNNETSNTYLRNFLSTEYTNATYHPYVEVKYRVTIEFVHDPLTIYVDQTRDIAFTTVPAEEHNYIEFFIDDDYFLNDPENRVSICNDIPQSLTGLSVGSEIITATVNYVDMAVGYYELGSFQVNVITPPLDNYEIVFKTYDGITPVYHGSGYGITLQNDSDLTADRQYFINAKLKINDDIQDNASIEYHFLDDISNELLGGNTSWVDIENGYVKLHNSYYMNGTAHKTGTVRVEASCPQYPTASAILNVSVICEDMDEPTGNGIDGIYVMGGRHIRIPFSGIPNNNSAFSSCLSFYNMTSEVDPYNFNWQYYTSTDWLAYKEPVTGGYRYKRFFELIRNSKVATIVTHGAPTSIVVNSGDNTNVFATSGDILELHQGYFNYCNLILLISCSTGSQTNNETNIAEAFANRGAGAVIAFTNDVIISDASTYETQLYNQLSLGRSIYNAFLYVNVTGCFPTIMGDQQSAHIDD